MREVIFPRKDFELINFLIEKMLSSADFNGVLLEKFYSEYVAFKFHLRADAAHLFVLYDVWICRPNIFGNGSMCGMFFKG